MHRGAWVRRGGGARQASGQYRDLDGMGAPALRSAVPLDVSKVTGHLGVIDIRQVDVSNAAWPAALICLELKRRTLHEARLRALRFR